ncbi:MAG: hypothetical protein HY331_00185 [Chloroflexi bacterium]|nr:hypothetical protein [Chloroflexota bacterium]
METPETQASREAGYRPIEFEARPGETFNVLRLNLPVPRRFFSQRTSDHLRAALHELRLAAKSLVDEQLDRVERMRRRTGSE